MHLVQVPILLVFRPAFLGVSRIQPDSCAWSALNRKEFGLEPHPLSQGQPSRALVLGCFALALAHSTIPTLLLQHLFISPLILSSPSFPSHHALLSELLLMLHEVCLCPSFKAHPLSKESSDCSSVPQSCLRLSSEPI